MRRLPTLKQLEYLLELAETQHFGRAADRCHVTQSTLSAGIRELESVLGAPVAERSNRQVLMTGLGRAIAERGKAILLDAEELMEHARSSNSPLGGEIRLGVIPTISPFLLPQVLPALGQKYPELRLFLREDQTEPVLRRLRDGDLDAALIALPYETPGLTVQVLMDDEFFFACGAAHPLADTGPVSMKALSDQPLMLLEEGHCLRGHALDACTLGNTQTRAQFEASSLHTLVQMVAAGIGVTLLPKLAIDAQITARTDISLLRLKAPAFRQIGLVWRETSARAESFQLLGLELCEQVRVLGTG